MTNHITSFPPVLPAQMHVLILGSMPGVRSLAMHQYYGHPRNHFWPIMDVLCGASLALSYAERLAKVKAAGIGLWDVLQQCERAGSLDTNIVRATEVPNDLPALLAVQPTLRAIAFNGKKAETAFRRHILPLLSPEQQNRITLLPLPSTSPANVTLSLAAKLARWESLLAYL
ncbi:MAG: DNA-deoxyinosine glycosylase [Caldilineaceae bacterium]